jgi:hypothetical protein
MVVLTWLTLPAQIHAALWDEQTDSLEAFLYTAAAEPVVTPPVAQTAASPVVPASAPVLDPGVASTLAIVPGFLVHGSGHFYAGRPGTGALLLAAEVGSLYLTYLGVQDIQAASQNADPADPDYTGDTSQLSRGVGYAAVGIVIFLGSWLYDLAGAPIAVQEQEAKRKQASQTQGMILRPRWTGQSVALVVEHPF